MYVAGVVPGLGSLGAGGDRCLAAALVGFRCSTCLSGGSRSPADDVEAGRSPCNNYLYVHAVKSAARLEHFFDVAQSEGQGRTNYTAASMLASCRLGASRQAPARSPAGAAKPPATTPRATADVLEGSRGHLIVLRV